MLSIMYLALKSNLMHADTLSMTMLNPEVGDSDKTKFQHLKKINTDFL